MIRILFIGLLFVGLSSCQAKQNPSSEKGVAKQDTVPESVQAQFPFPAIPSTLTEPSPQSLPAHPLLGAFRLCRHYLGE